MKLPLIILSLSFLVGQSAMGQEFGINMVLNGGFEQSQRSPTGNVSRDFKQLLFWFNPTFMTPDYYNVETEPLDCVVSKEGKGYAGGLGGEFIEGRLKCPLVADKKYRFTMFVNPAIPCLGGIVSDRAGVYFSHEQLSKRGNKRKDLSLLEPHISSPAGIVLKDTVNWEMVSGEYVARGGERYIIIGFFRGASRSFTIEYLQNHVRHGLRWRSYKPGKTIRQQYRAAPRYYAYDDVSLVPIDSAGEPVFDYDMCIDTVGILNNIGHVLEERNYTGFLPHLKFKEGSFNLEKKSEKDVAYVYMLLNSGQNQDVELLLHCDSALTTMEDCENRFDSKVKALKKVFESWDIDTDRVKFINEGTKFPLPTDLKETLGISDERIEYHLIPK